MKKALLAPLLSAFVLPGLGQVVNRQVFKGMGLIFLVTLWLLGFMTLAALKVYSAVAVMDPAAADPNQALGEALAAQDWTWPLVLLAFFVVLWLYAVVDAHRGGRRADARIAAGQEI